MASGLDLRSREARWTVVRAQAGDRAALDRLLRAVQSPLLTHIAGIVQDDDAALDVLQDTLLLVARRLTRLRDPRWFRAWCYRIATREAVRQARKSKRWVELTPDELAGLRDPDADDAPRYDPDLVARVPALIAALSPASQAVVRMHYVEGMTLAEIAEALEAPPGTIRSRLHYGLEAIRGRMA